MPATYTIDPEAGLVRIACSGVFTNQEMITVWSSCTGNPPGGPGCRP
jgi:hypothetical protein